MRNLRARASTATVVPLALWARLHQHSPAVIGWSRSVLPAARYGALNARVGGDGDRAVMLLHGLVSTGAIFGGGFDPLSSTGRLVVPDLLGFGDSLDEARSNFTVSDHLDALDELAERSGMFACKRWTLGAHSMGSALALSWAARHMGRVDRVTCWGAPLYASPADAQAQISGTLMARLFVLDTEWAERACALSCRYRTAAGWLTAAVEPRLPIPVARAVSMHTWPAYRDAMRHLVVETDWSALVLDLERNGTRLRLVWGDRDPIGDRGYAYELASQMSNGETEVVNGADHQLPMTDPAMCLQQLEPWAGSMSESGRLPVVVEQCS